MPFLLLPQQQLLPQQLPVHVFIADGERAIFAIPGGSGEASEFGFISEETGLVRALSAIWLRYLGEARRVEGAPAVKVSRMRAG